MASGILTLCGHGEDQGIPSVPSWGLCCELIQVRYHFRETASITLLQNVPLRSIPAVYDICLDKPCICHLQKMRPLTGRAVGYSYPHCNTMIFCGPLLPHAVGCGHRLEASPHGASQEELPNVQGSWSWRADVVF